MQKKIWKAATKAIGSGISGIIVMKNELLEPNEMILIVGAKAYEQIKNSDKLKEQSK